jgi:hypothetical protein
MTPYMTIEEIGSTLSGNSGVGRDEVCPFADKVDNVQNGIVSMCLCNSTGNSC